MKTGRTAPELPLFRKAVSLHKTVDLRKTVDLCRIRDLRKALDLRKAFSIRRILNIRKILLPLDGRNGTHRVSKACKDKAGRPVLDAEEVTVSLSMNVKG